MALCPTRTLFHIYTRLFPPLSTLFPLQGIRLQFLCPKTRRNGTFRRNFGNIYTLAMGSEAIPSYAHRPVNPAKEKGLPPHVKWWLTEIDRIVDFRHDAADTINYAEEVPLGEGQFLIKWKGIKKAEWIEGDNVIKHGPEAVRRYFSLVRRRRILAQKCFNKLTHISSLNDIVCGGITDESGTHYKMIIAGPSPAFVRELIHPEWGKNITRNFQIVRENGVAYVWVNRIQAQYIFRRTVHNFERRERVMPSPEEINAMSPTDLALHEKRTLEGYYLVEDDECNEADDRAQPMYK